MNEQDRVGTVGNGFGRSNGVGLRCPGNPDRTGPTRGTPARKSLAEDPARRAVKHMVSTRFPVAGDYQAFNRSAIPRTPLRGHRVRPRTCADRATPGVRTPREHDERRPDPVDRAVASSMRVSTIWSVVLRCFACDGCQRPPRRVRRVPVRPARGSHRPRSRPRCSSRRRTR